MYRIGLRFGWALPILEVGALDGARRWAMCWIDTIPVEFSVFVYAYALYSGLLTIVCCAAKEYGWHLPSTLCGKSLARTAGAILGTWVRSLSQYALVCANMPLVPTRFVYVARDAGAFYNKTTLLEIIYF